MDAPPIPLRHVVATIAYRGAKALRGAPPEFADFKASPTTRTPVEILAHIGDLMQTIVWFSRGERKWQDTPPLPWPEEVARFHSILETLDQQLAGGVPEGLAFDRAFQGPIADALTHIGQINLLRRMAGSPVKGEAYFYAGVEIGRVGADQAKPDPKYEFD
jgi:hypothetical protein